MTWSIIAKDPETGAFGVAVTTKFFAVGALCPHGAASIGALATQALVNPLYGTDGIRFLAEGPKRRGDRGGSHRAAIPAGNPASFT